MFWVPLFVVGILLLYTHVELETCGTGKIISYIICKLLSKVVDVPTSNILFLVVEGLHLFAFNNFTILCFLGDCRLGPVILFV